MKIFQKVFIVALLIIIALTGFIISKGREFEPEVSVYVEVFKIDDHCYFLRWFSDFSDINTDEELSTEINLFFPSGQEKITDIKKTMFLDLQEELDSVILQISFKNTSISVTGQTEDGKIFLPEIPVVYEPPYDAGSKIDILLADTSEIVNFIYPDSFMIERAEVEHVISPSRENNVHHSSFKIIGYSTETMFSDSVEDDVYYVYRISTIYSDSIFKSETSSPIASFPLDVPEDIEFSGKVKFNENSGAGEVLLEVKIPRLEYFLTKNQQDDHSELFAVPESILIYRVSNSDSVRLSLQELEIFTDDLHKNDNIFLDSDIDEAKSYRYKILVYYSNGVVLSSNAIGPFRYFREWFDLKKISLFIGGLIFTFGIIFFIWQAKKGKKLFVRKINGIDAVDEAIGRATEMGKDVLFIPGIMDMDDVQTIAGMIILGRIAKKVANYETKISVPSIAPVAYNTAKEVVRQAFIQAGKPDAYNDDMVYYITGDQFGYAAAVDGIMIREKPATIFLMGHFYAESLILAETGHSVGAIQIAGTADPSQLPFFIAACDYTLIGEEFFAASAYLSEDPQLLGSLKAQDAGKAVAIISIIIGSILISFGFDWIARLFFTG